MRYANLVSHSIRAPEPASSIGANIVARYSIATADGRQLLAVSLLTVADTRDGSRAFSGRLARAGSRFFGDLLRGLFRDDAVLKKRRNGRHRARGNWRLGGKIQPLPKVLVPTFVPNPSQS